MFFSGFWGKVGRSRAYGCYHPILHEKPFILMLLIVSELGFPPKCNKSRFWGDPGGPEKALKDYLFWGDFIRNIGDPYWPACYKQIMGWGDHYWPASDNQILGFGIDQNWGFGIGH